MIRKTYRNIIRTKCRPTSIHFNAALIILVTIIINLVVIVSGQISTDSVVVVNDNQNFHHHQNIPKDNRPRFPNGTIFQFGGNSNRGQNSQNVLTFPSSSSSSNVIHNNNNNNRFKTRPITGSVINVHSDRINVNDDNNNGNDRSFGEENQPSTIRIQDHQHGGQHHPLHNQIDHIDHRNPSIIHHHHRPQNIHYEVSSGQDHQNHQQPIISHYNRSALGDDDHRRRLITSAHQGSRTDLESYHRAAIINPDDTVIGGSNIGHHYHGTIVDVTDNFARGNQPGGGGVSSHPNYHHSGLDSPNRTQIHHHHHHHSSAISTYPSNVRQNSTTQQLNQHSNYQQQVNPINQTTTSAAINHHSGSNIHFPIGRLNNQTQAGGGGGQSINGQRLRTFNNNNGNRTSAATVSSQQQQPGTAFISLNSLDNNVNIVDNDVEAINKARIYAEQANEEQAKKQAQNVVRLAATDQLESEIITNRTRAYLSCESGEMIVKINFTEPFRGIGYADYDRSSPCKFYGDGGRYYEMRLPLKGCGTKQEAPRIFINNIILRFHRALELEEDEIKTIVCRYPPPLAPPPPLIAAPILEQPPPMIPFIPAKLSEIELLLIVSALLFLTLLLLGIGIGYYCLKKRKVKVIRKFVPPAEIPYFPPSSEEHSIISEGSIIHHDDYQFQNLGYIPEAKLSYMDDIFYQDKDFIENDVVQTQQNLMVPTMPIFDTRKFDDHFIMHGSETDIDTDYEVDRLIVPKKPRITKLITEKYFVTPKTTTEIVDEIITHRVIVPPKKTLLTKYLDDTMITPQIDNEIDETITNQRRFGPAKPSLQSEKVDDTYVHSAEELDIIDDIEQHRIRGPTKQPKLTTTDQDDYFHSDIYEIDEVIDNLDETIINATRPLTQSTVDDDYITHSRDLDEFLDNTVHRRRLVPKPSTEPPKIMVKNIDDFYITNITETETNEQTTKIGRSMPNLTLEIDYEEHEQEEYDEQQERLIEEEEQTTKSRLTGFDVRLRSIPRKPLPQHTTTTTSISETTTTTKIDEIIRVLNNPPRDQIPNIDEYFMLPTRNRFRQIILTDEIFRTLICESTTIDEYVERIEKHPSYGPLFEPPTWEIIFRLLSLPEVNQRRPPPTTRYSDTYRSGFSAQEVRSVTEEDVTFSRNRISSGHYVPLPDYPMDDDNDQQPSLSGNRWLPDPKRYECYSPDFTPIKPAFKTIHRYGSGRRSRPSGTISPTSPSTSVFGTRRLENPYTTTTNSSIKQRLYDYDFRPYSPDLDALSLEPSQSYLAYSGSIRRRNQIQSIEEREEIKSTTETNVYDWKRYS